MRGRGRASVKVWGSGIEDAGRVLGVVVFSKDDEDEVEVNCESRGPRAMRSAMRRMKTVDMKRRSGWRLEFFLGGGASVDVVEVVIV